MRNESMMEKKKKGYKKCIIRVCVINRRTAVKTCREWRIEVEKCKTKEGEISSGI
jgi:hypothetical protein